MDHILFWIVVGVIAGWLAKIVVPGEVIGGALSYIVVGIVGAVIGGSLFNTVDGSFYGRPFDGGLIANIGVAFVGAVVLLAIIRFI